MLMKKKHMKDTQCYYLLGKLKPHGDTTAYQLKWLNWQWLTILSVGRNAEQLELSHIVGGKVKWYNQKAVAYKVKYTLNVQTVIAHLSFS